MTLRLTAILLLSAGTGLAHAQPANNNFANAEVVTALPFADMETGIGNATVEATDPLLLCYTGAPSTGQQTVWYRYTTGATTEYVTLTTAGSNYDTLLSVHTGAPGQLQLVSGACSDNSDGVVPQAQSRNVGVRFKPNTTYYIEVAAHMPISPATLTLSIAPAVQYHVTTTADTADGSCDAHCSLREAITAATTTAGAIFVPAGSYVITRVGLNDDANLTGDFDIRSSMAIYGAGTNLTVIGAGAVDRVFDIRNSTVYADALLADMTITGGGLFTGDQGAGIHGPDATAFLSLDRVAITGNNARGSFGGGVYTRMRMLMRDSTVDNNRAQLGGGLALRGGSTTIAYIERSAITNNRSEQGGGIFAENRLRIDNTTISRNVAVDLGGGIDLFAGSLQLHSTTVADNFALGTALGGSGGGGLRLGSSGDVAIANSIIAGNSASDAGMTHNCFKTGSGALTTSYSLIHFTAGGCAFTGAGDITGLLADLVPLADNGGPTLTQAINLGSPGRNAGNPAGCVDHLGRTLVTDQRGGFFVRSYDGRCDMGAFEVQVPPATVPGVPDLVAASDSGSSTVDNLTNDSTPIFTGNCGTGDTIEMLANSNVLAPQQVCTGGAYSITVTTSLGDGPYEIVARATRATVEVSTGTLIMFVDTFAAPPTLIGPSTGGRLPTFVGNNAEANALVTVSTAAGVVCTQTADVTGNWSCTATTAMPFGPTDVFARQRDFAGNESAASPPIAYLVEATVPGTPDLAAASDSGGSDVDNLTNDNTPTFAGSCADGDFVVILSGGTGVSLSQICAGGAYSITVDLTLSDGPQDIAARAFAGTDVISAGALALVVDTVALPPTIVGPSIGPAAPTFTGANAEANALVTVSRASGDVCAQTADLNGNWSCTVSTVIPDGTSDVFVRQRDFAGNDSVLSPPFAYTVVDAVFANGFE